MLRFAALLLTLSLLSPGASLRADDRAPAQPAPQTPLAVPGFNVKATANFDDLRHNILELIGSGRKRVWILTDYLTDGELASALFLAKYRNLDVRIFLGREKLLASQSRLAFFRGQNMPVFIRPSVGYVTPTMLFVDQRLYGVGRDLNVLQRFGANEITQASPSEVKSFVSWMRDVMDKPEPAVSRYRGPIRTPKERVEDSAGAYNYDATSGGRKAPPGAQRELPKVPRWKVIKEMKDKAPPEAPAPSPSPERAPEPQAPVQSPIPAAPAPQPAPAAEPAPAPGRPWVNPTEPVPAPPQPEAPAGGDKPSP